MELKILFGFIQVVLPIIAIAITYGKLTQKVENIENIINAKLGNYDLKIQKDLNKMNSRFYKNLTELSERVIVVETKLEIDSEKGTFE